MTDALKRGETMLKEVELAQHWNLSVRTLQKWRQTGEGPRWRKIGGLVRYSWDDIEEFEEKSRKENTSHE